MIRNIRYLFVVPGIHSLQTGGNIYNRHIIQHLSVHFPVDWQIWNDKLQLFAEGTQKVTTCLILDSLLIGKVDIQLLRLENPEWKFILLVHFLELLKKKGHSKSTEATDLVRLKDFDGFITTSKYSKEKLVDLGVPRKKISDVTPGLSNSFRKTFSSKKSDDSPVILTVASILPDKGLETMLEILEGIKETEWHWNIIGEQSLDPDYTRHMVKRLAASPVSDSVTLAKSLDHQRLVDEYDQSHIFALASNFESCGMVIREAMSRALPVICYKTGGIDEHISAVNEACVVKLDDKKAFTRELTELIKNPVKRNFVGKNALLCSQKLKDWEQVTLQFHQSILRMVHGQVMS